MNVSHPERPYAIACDRNRDPILAVLRECLPAKGRVLEIGSGTGQHAAYFSSAFPNLDWLPSDLPQHLAGISLWRQEAGQNCLAPVGLDLLSDALQLPQADAIVCINTLHIVAWQGTHQLFTAAGRMLSPGQAVYLYGPYRYRDRVFEPSNEAFDRWLKAQDPMSGIRDYEAIETLAESTGFSLGGDKAMPANNRSLWWIRNGE